MRSAVLAVFMTKLCVTIKDTNWHFSKPSRSVTQPATEPT
jgi:hypothetical protein